MDPLQQLLDLFHQRAAIYKQQMELYQVKLDHFKFVMLKTSGKPTTPSSAGVYIGMLATTSGGIEICSTSMQYIDSQYRLVIAKEQ